jgi:hypothetical protein
MIRVSRTIRRSLVVASAALVTGCGTTTYPYRLEVMPPPAIYATGAVPVPDSSHLELADGRVRVPYATWRRPAADDDAEPHYGNERGNVLRLGLADLRTEGGHRGPAEDAGRSAPVTPVELELSDAVELGVLPETRPPFAPVDFGAMLAREGPREFADALDRILLDGAGRDIYIYVHGYKVVFENAVAVSTELWHYLDYEGAFIAFAWPATPRRLAYLGDLETAEASATMLSRFIDYLDQQTPARRIHVIGYSAGSRVVTSALSRLALSRAGARSDPHSTVSRIGQVVLVGSDMDRQLLGLELADGILDLVDGVTVYVSSKDRALAVPRTLYGRERAGEVFTAGSMPPSAMQWLRANPKLYFIDVTDAAESTSENGHRYFRKSPWVSSDMLMMLRFGLKPGERGLERSDESTVWSFPPDYIERLAVAVAKSGVAPPAIQPQPAAKQ